MTSAVVSAEKRVPAGVELVGELARAGEGDLATIQAIRFVASWTGDQDAAPWYRPALASVLNDLGVLRYQAGDARAARSCLQAAVGLDGGPTDAVENLQAVESEVRAAATTTSSLDEGVENPAVDALTPWVAEALEMAARSIGFNGKSVLEVGGAVPEEAALGTGARRWTACDLAVSAVQRERYEVVPADACSLPFPDDTFDAIFSSNAFEHILDLTAALAEMRRVLRPGGLLFSRFAPIWSSSQGHHVYVRDDAGALLSFTEPIVPAWGHLLLTERELESFLAITYGAETARRAVDFVYRNSYLNRVFDADYRRILDASGLVPRGSMEWKSHVPGAALRRELDVCHPGGHDFSAFGFIIVLGNPA